MLEVANLSVRYGSLQVLDSVSFALPAGQWLMVAGPNGAGKSTLLSAVAQGLSYSGTVRIDGRDAAKIRPLSLARELGVLSQTHQVGYAFTVEEVVNLGRYAYRRGRLSFSDGEGEDKVRLALEMTGMLPLRRHSVLTLSGGELQRTFLAQLFAQDPRLILLDEPANHLDLKYQKQMFDLIGEWAKQPGRAVVSVVHDIAMARSYGTCALLMDRGRQVALGGTREVLSPENLQRVYGMDVQGWMRDMLARWTE